MMSEMTSMTQSWMSSWINREACAACAHLLSKNCFSLFAIRIHFASACLKQSERVLEQWSDCARLRLRKGQHARN